MRQMELVVLFDGGCPMCRATVRRLHALDWLHRLRFVDGSNARLRERVAPGLSEQQVFMEMYVVEPSGRRFGGYEAFLRIARVIPIMWPLLVVGVLPGIRHLGRRIYRVIAANRIRRGRCTDDFCET